MYYWTVHSFFHTADAYGFQVENLSQATQDRDSHFVVHLRTICDSVLYTYLSKVADTAEKRHYLHASCAAVDKTKLLLKEIDAFLDKLYKFKVFDLHPSAFQPHDLRVLLATTSCSSVFSIYLESFRSDPERSREFHYEEARWHAFVATRYMRFLRTPSNSR